MTGAGVQIAFDFLRGVAPSARNHAQALTSQALTSQALTSQALTSQALTSQALTSTALRHATAAVTPAPPTPQTLPSTDRPASAVEARAVLETRLRAAVSLPLRLTITDNRRTMISLRRGRLFVEIRLHHMFLDADALTHEALSRYLFQSDRLAAQQIGRFIDRHREQIRRETARKPRPVCALGTHHDLAEIYRAMNQRYFADAVDARITWSRDPQPRRSRRSIKLGSYTARERLIRVHPALDAAFVPRFFVEYIVYHEMLHQVLPPKQQGGRRDLHGPTFKARERQFEQYALALRWEREHLDRLLRRRTAAHKSGSGTRNPSWQA